jgi:hypothetical protein
MASEVFSLSKVNLPQAVRNGPAGGLYYKSLTKKGAHRLQDIVFGPGEQLEAPWWGEQLDEFYGNNSQDKEKYAQADGDPKQYFLDAAPGRENTARITAS